MFAGRRLVMRMRRRHGVTICNPLRLITLYNHLWPRSILAVNPTWWTWWVKVCEGRGQMIQSTGHLNHLNVWVRDVPRKDTLNLESIWSAARFFSRQKDRTSDFREWWPRHSNNRRGNKRSRWQRTLFSWHTSKVNQGINYVHCRWPWPSPIARQKSHLESMKAVREVFPRMVFSIRTHLTRHSVPNVGGFINTLDL